uniref:Uncharacterized protein n=1 Tax=Rangifer tarandus platyrhynchus TaxID=3082113 RepID=A0ACB0E6F5_RANTA|nr:unnamed protein product [Rangifer tarandus platyrhynchus]
MGALTSGERRGRAGGVQDTWTRAAAAPSSGHPTPDPGSGALHRRGHPPQPAADKAPGSGAIPGRRPRAKPARPGERGAPAGGAGGAALTWMVQVYSLSSSSRTVQLYSRSRLLLLPLINLLSIFPPARLRERRGGAADPAPGAPQPGSSAPAPSTCTITPARSPPLPPARPAPPPSPPPSPPPPSPSPEQAPDSLCSAPHCPCPACGAGTRPEGGQWGSARRNRVTDGRANRNRNCDDRQVRDAIAAKQLDRKVRPALWRPKPGAPFLSAVRIDAVFPSPGPGAGNRLDQCQLFGIYLASSSGPKSHALQRRGSRLSGA